MNPPKKTLKWFVILFIAIVTISIGICGIYFLRKEKMLFFSTGTNIYAFYNSTWEMSSKEVEKNNKCILELDSGLFSLTLHFPTHPEIKANMLLNEERLIGKKCSNQKVFGYNTDIYYGFFDDKLYKVRIEGKSYDQEEFDSIIILNLEKYYGKVQRDSTRTSLEY